MRFIIRIVTIIYDSYKNHSKMILMYVDICIKFPINLELILST